MPTTRPYAAAQLIGDRSHQCDATATAPTKTGGRAYVLLDGIGSDDTVRDWTRNAARRLAQAVARRGDAEAGLRAVYTRYADEPERHDPWQPSAAAVVAVAAPGRPLTVAWCGDARAYLLTRGITRRLTEDHNLRRVYPPTATWPDGGNRNVITSYLGATHDDDQCMGRYGHPAIETVTVPLPGPCRLVLASDGAYEPHEDAGHDLYIELGDETPIAAAREFVTSAVEHAAEHADNATVLVADL